MHPDYIIALKKRIKAKIETVYAQMKLTSYETFLTDLTNAMARIMEAEVNVQTRQEIKAFGGCTKCYGKGYGTATYGTRAEGDFEGERGYIVPTGVHMEFCKCPRGKQLEVLLRNKT